LTYSSYGAPRGASSLPLYTLPSPLIANRKLSLRFLAWVILREEIQLDMHDSIEDSFTALKLYKKYLEYVDAGILDAILNNIQAEGMKTGFKPPNQRSTGPMEAGTGRMETPPIVREGRSEAGTPLPNTRGVGVLQKWPG
jgi:PAB-dependent poly(A)-specific ribonuclease subunit 2